MNIGSIGISASNQAWKPVAQGTQSPGKGAAFQAVLDAQAATPGASQAETDPLAPHLPGPGDKILDHLTAKDRDLLFAQFGIEVTANGEIAESADHDGPASIAGLAAIGQLASDRAQGRVTGDITEGYLKNLFSHFRARIDAEMPLWDSHADKSRVSLTA